MSTPDTRPPAITEEQLQRLIHAMQRHGANVNVTDPRVSAVQAWIFAAVGSGVVAASIWGAKGLNDLNTTVNVAIVQLGHQAKVQEDHEIRLRNLERK